MSPFYHFNVLLMCITEHKLHNFRPVNSVEKQAFDLTKLRIFTAQSVLTENDHVRRLACHAPSRTSMKHLPSRSQTLREQSG
jgi:hypothetical protein